MHEQEIQACLGFGIQTLKADKAVYWAAQGKSDFHEMNMVLHAGIGLKRGGCAVYAEVQVRGAPRKHVDLFAVHVSHVWAIAVEAKRVYTTLKAGEFANDWDRLAQLKMPNQHGGLPQGLACYAGLMASCWSKAYVDWWCNTTRPSAPARIRRTTNWGRLKAYLDKSAVCNAVDVQRKAGNPHWILYALTRLPDDQF